MCWHSLTQQKITIIYVEEAIQDIADEIKFTNIEEIKKCASLLRKEVWKNAVCVREPLFCSIAVDLVVPDIYICFYV